MARFTLQFSNVTHAILTIMCDSGVNSDLISATNTEGLCAGGWYNHRAGSFARQPQSCHAPYSGGASAAAVLAAAFQIYAKTPILNYL